MQFTREQKLDRLLNDVVYNIDMEYRYNPSEFLHDMLEYIRKKRKEINGI
jgi:hypothetical protein